MDTREKLIELFFNAEQMVHIPYGMNTKEAERYVFEQMADHLIANGVTVNEWISVKDRLPDKDGAYLVFEKGSYGNQIRTLRFAKDGRKVDKYDFHRGWKNVWYRYDSEWGHITIDSVTHWMPLPQPPKGE